MPNTSGNDATLSLCMCTYKRPDGVRRALDSLAACNKPSGRRIEIVVVDNDSAGTTKHVVDSFLASHPGLELKYAVESAPGIAAARNRCLMESSGEWVTFVDDDEYVDAAWLMELIAVQERTDADAVFGPVVAAFTKPTPSWVATTDAYMRKRHGTGEMIDWRDARTGNVLLRRSLASRIGGFDPSFQLTGAEDSAFFAMASQAGARLAWADTALVFETIPPDRISRRWLCRRSFHGSRNYVRVLARVHGRWAFAQEIVKGMLGLPAYAALLLLAVGTGSTTSLKWSRRLCGSWGKLAALWSVDELYGRG
jgi:succinoglycan biosynthesis protein ExoM